MKNSRHLKLLQETAEKEFHGRGMDLAGIHGPVHWNMVGLTAGILLASNGHNPLIGTYFGMLHDCCREDDFQDPGHGLRAAALTRTIRNKIRLDDEEFGKLVRAMEIHDTSDTPGEGSIEGCCLDGDRLDLGRCGIRLDTDYISTPQAHDLISDPTFRLHTPHGSLLSLWHGTKEFEMETGAGIRLKPSGYAPIYLTEDETITSWYGDPYRVLLSTPSILDLTDTMRLINSPAFKTLRKIDRRMKREKQVFNSSGEPFDLFLALESGQLYNEDPTRRLTEGIIREIVDGTGHQAIRFYDDSLAHEKDGEPIPSWVTYNQITSILWI